MGLPFHGSPLVPPPYLLFLPNTNETCPHPSKEGRGAWAGYTFDVTTHIPQRGEGQAGGMLGTSPHPSGERRGKKRAGRWRLEVVAVVDEPKINCDRR